MVSLSYITETWHYTTTAKVSFSVTFKCFSLTALQFIILEKEAGELIVILLSLEFKFHLNCFSSFSLDQRLYLINTSSDTFISIFLTYNQADAFQFSKSANSSAISKQEPEIVFIIHVWSRWRLGTIISKFTSEYDSTYKTNKRVCPLNKPPWWAH